MFFRLTLLIVSVCFWLTSGTALATSLTSGRGISEQSIAVQDAQVQDAQVQDAQAQDARVQSSATQNRSNESLAAGAIAVSEGRYEEALQQFTQSIEQSPAVGYGNRCLVHLQMQHYALAIEDCAQSLVLKEHAEVRMNLGLAYGQAGEHDLAIAQYEKLLSTGSIDYRVYYNLALSKAAIGHHQAAISDYSHALRELPSNAGSTGQANIYRDRGASYLVLADYAAAVTDFNTALSRNPSDIWVYFNRGCAYHRSNNFLPALQDFNWVIENDDDNAHAYFNRGIIYARLGQSEAAIESLNQALQRFPHNTHADDILIPIQQAKQLVEHLENHLETDHSSDEIWSIFGDDAVSS